MVEHEVIVVGGGPAGSSAAWELVRNGVDCLVIDREAFPREKLCAGWITPEVLAALEFSPADYPHRFLTFETLRISVRGLKLPYRSPQHSIRRFEFDRWLLDRSGAPVVTHNVRRIERDGDGFVLDGTYRCRHLVGAGGTRCPVYRELFRAHHPRVKGLQVVTQELEFPYQTPDADCYLWFFHRSLPGYGWYVPKADGYVNVGIGGIADRLKAKGDDIKRHWRGLIDDLVEKGLLAGDPGEPGGYSYFLNACHPAPKLGNAFLVGDAAGLATRDMCEGIGPAVESGLMAARAVLGHGTFDLGRIAAHTLGQPIARRAMDLLLTGRAGVRTEANAAEVG
ncbi:MAG: NAD(P)/FAD-dependent oxidoreductase [Pseudomonadales bacterium]